ncbi:MAG: cardiolipin synthase [Gemmatimonadota bacterium]
MNALLLLVPIAFHGLGLVSSIDAVMSTRTPQGAVAWAVFLNTFPYLAVPAYWILGRSRFRGYVDARQDTSTSLARKLEGHARRRYALASGIRQERGTTPAERVAGMPYVRGNRLDLLIDGDATFASILGGLDRARDYILFQFFILKDDRIGQKVKHHLTERARAGIRVHVLYDEVGSHSLPRRYLRELREAGVQVFAFNTRKGPRNRFQINFRNHRKLVVVDGKEAWLGGHNVGDEYMGEDPRFGRWRDTHLHIVGPAAVEAQLAFAEDWYWATDEALELDWTPVPSSDGDAEVLVLPTGPADPLETAALMFTYAINSAEQRLWLATPYFVPDEGLMNALLIAGLRGVDVRVLIPDKPDHLPAYLAAFAYQSRSAETGVRFFRYTDGFLHQKVFIVDDRLAAIGSANFDNRSFRLNFEITALVKDADFVGRVHEMLEADFERSTPMPPDTFVSKPFWFRLAANVARLTAPVQ